MWTTWSKHEAIILAMQSSRHLSSMAILFFTFLSSFTLAEELLNHTLTYVGTIHKNWDGISPEIQPNKEHFSYVWFPWEYTKVSHINQKNKSVISISTMHHDVCKTANEKNKVKIATLYNHKKGRIDTLDKTYAGFCCKCAVCRWPVILFF